MVLGPDPRLVQHLGAGGDRRVEERAAPSARSRGLERDMDLAVRHIVGERAEPERRPVRRRRTRRRRRSASPARRRAARAPCRRTRCWPSGRGTGWRGDRACGDRNVGFVAEHGRYVDADLPHMKAAARDVGPRRGPVRLLPPRRPRTPASTTKGDSSDPPSCGRTRWASPESRSPGASAAVFDVFAASRPVAARAPSARCCEPPRSRGSETDVFTCDPARIDPLAEIGFEQYRAWDHIRTRVARRPPRRAPARRLLALRDTAPPLAPRSGSTR